MRMKNIIVLIVVAMLAVSCAKQNTGLTSAEATATSNSAVTSSPSFSWEREDQANGMDEEANMTPLANLDDPDVPGVAPVLSEMQTAWGKIQRKTLPWAKDITVYHEVPVFHEENEAIKKINATMQEVSAHFLSKENLQDVWQYEFDRHQDKNTESMDEGENYVDFVYVVYIYKTDKIVSISLSYGWFMGGTMDYGLNNYNFDATTGKMIRLEDIYHTSIEEIRKMIIQKMKNDIQNQTMEIPEEDIYWDSIEAMETFDFYIKDDIPHVTFDKYEISYGAAGSFDIELPRP